MKNEKFTLSESGANLINNALLDGKTALEVMQFAHSEGRTLRAETFDQNGNAEWLSVDQMLAIYGGDGSTDAGAKEDVSFFKVVVNVETVRNSVDIDDLSKHMRRSFESAIGSGALTGHTEAEVQTHDLSVTTASTEVEMLQKSITRDIARLREIATYPVDISFAENLSFEIRPKFTDDRFHVLRKGWGWTTVNYTHEGVIADVFGEQSTTCLATLSASKQELVVPDEADDAGEGALVDSQEVAIREKREQLIEQCGYEIINVAVRGKDHWWCNKNGSYLADFADKNDAEVFIWEKLNQQSLACLSYDFKIGDKAVQALYGMTEELRHAFMLFAHLGDKEKRVFVYLDAFSTSDHETGPSHALTQVDYKLLKRMFSSQLIIIEHAVIGVRMSDAPDFWFPKGIENELRLQSPEMVVSRDSFLFTDIPKYSSALIETRSCAVSTLMQAFHTADDGDYVSICDAYQLVDELKLNLDEIWCEDYAKLAHAEGWCLSDVIYSFGTVIELQKVDDSNIFKSNQQACQHVWDKANMYGVGSIHAEALAVLKLVSPDEYEKVIALR